MFQKKFLQQLQKNYLTNIKEKRMIISSSNNILHNAKRIIFTIHRQELTEAEKDLINIEKTIKQLQQNFGYHRLIEEGAYLAGVEEYVEAKTFYWITTKQNIQKIKNIKLSTVTYLGGISDLTGELVRQAINAAAEHNFAQVKYNYEIIREVLSYLIKFDLTGYLRTKYDQAKNNLRKIEQINYEINLKR